MTLNDEAKNNVRHDFAKTKKENDRNCRSLSRSNLRLEAQNKELMKKLLLANDSEESERKNNIFYKKLIKLLENENTKFKRDYTRLETKYKELLKKTKGNADQSKRTTSNANPPTPPITGSMSQE